MKRQVLPVVLAALLVSFGHINAQQAATTAHAVYFIIDDLHLQFSETPRIRDLFNLIATKIVQEGDLFGVASTGTSAIAVDFTADRTRLSDAAIRITGGGMKPYEFIQPSGRAEVVRRVHVALAAILAGLQTFPADSNRKTIVLISAGYDVDPTQTDLVEEVTQLALEANRVNAHFYTVDPLRLVVVQNPQQTVDPAAWEPHRQRMEASLRTLAEQTGGVFVQSIADLQALR